MLLKTRITYTKLGTLKITQNGDRMRIFLFDRPNHVKKLLLLLLRSVAEVKTENISSSQEKSFNHLDGAGSRSKSGNLLCGLAPSLSNLRNSCDSCFLRGTFDSGSQLGACGESARSNKCIDSTCQEGNAEQKGGKLHSFISFSSNNLCSNLEVWLQQRLR